MHAHVVMARYVIYWICISYDIKMKENQSIGSFTTEKGSKVIVRAVSRSDSEKLRSFINELSREKTYIRFQGEEMSREAEQTYIDGFVDSMEKGKALKLLAFKGDTLVGVADVYLRDRVESHVGVFGLTVALPYRGRGIGTLLLTLMLKHVRDAIPALRILTLGVFATNAPAIRLYEGHGFIRHGLLPGGLLHKGEYVDHIDMHRIIRR